MRYLLSILCILLIAASAAQAESDRQPIGLVKAASGDAAILRDARRVTAKPGNQLFQGDVLSTGATGSLGVILRDDTVLSLGPSSEAHLDQFAFKPAEQKLGMVLKFTRGVISYLSGKVAKLAPGSVRLETPSATLGVRGTYLAVRIEP
ncbi:MAG: FecR domain-containing protein [Desulfuromonadales bacterium]|nr:FecR domain-containing protein [Desulfuromonadales bacterium]